MANMKAIHQNLLLLDPNVVETGSQRNKEKIVKKKKIRKIFSIYIKKP